ncbi:MAG: uroporphyrinogen-III synthase [Bacteroidales bacterium]|nr:uroporphyrinogen-III synthase [Bacteroidales bacterium]MCF8455774.1 uroporphyrinogen-III synthase [Bacteroidales bacterium]
MKIRTVLVSQPRPESEKSPYFDLARKLNLKIDFRPFIHVEEISAKEFRKSKIDIRKHSSVIFTSRTAIDHYFRICDEMRIPIEESMKYFCISESTAYYLQKYITYRKRKVIYGERKFEDLLDLLKKHQSENFLVPLSDKHKQEIPELLEAREFQFSKAILYKTVMSNLSDLENVYYDILVFFSPSGIQSLFKNFPDFKQNTTRIAAFGPSTSQAVKDMGLRLDIQAPTPQAPSMTMALDNYIRKFNKQNGSK